MNYNTDMRKRLEVHIVVANRDLLTLNDKENSDCESDIEAVVQVLKNIVFYSVLGNTRWWGRKLGCRNRCHFQNIS